MKYSSSECKETLRKIASLLCGKCNKASRKKVDIPVNPVNTIAEKNSHLSRLKCAMNKYKISEHYFVVKILGKGSRSKVYLLCNKATGDSDRVIKVATSTKITKKKFEHELRMTRLFHDLGFGPKVYEANWLDEENTFYMISERIDETLEDYLKKKRSKREINHVFSLIHELLEKMRLQNVLHGDFHSGNIGLKRKNKRLEIVLIDFGSSFYKPTRKMVVNGLYNIEFIQLYRVEKFVDNKYPSNAYVVQAIEKIMEDILGKENAKYFQRYSQNELGNLIQSYYSLYK